MDGDRSAYVILLLLTLTLPVMALMGRRLPMRNMLRLGLFWVAIFVGGMLIVQAVSG